MSDDLLLELEGVHKHFAAGSVHVLRGLDLRVRRGEMVAITGPSGSGKSTLLEILGTLDRPDQGSYRFEGRDMVTRSEGERLSFRRRELGFVFQSHHLLPYLTVLENALLPTILTGERDLARARALLERVGLTHRLDHRPAALSVGERQRVALVRALVGKPGLVLADEPTGSLNREGSEGLGDLLVELNRQEGTTLVVATHDEALAKRAQRALRLTDGVLSPRQDP